VYTVWNVPAEQRVYYFDKTLGRIFEPDQRPVVLPSHPDWPLMTFTSDPDPSDVEARDNRYP